MKPNANGLHYDLSQDGLVVTIKGPQGSGKTTMSKDIQDRLKRNGATFTAYLDEDNQAEVVALHAGQTLLAPFAAIVKAAWMNAGSL